MTQKHNLKQACLDMVSDDTVLLFADGLDSAILGITEREGYELVVYDSEKIMRILRHRDGMNIEEAHEFFEVNIACAWIGERTPIFIRPVQTK